MENARGTFCHVEEQLASRFLKFRNKCLSSKNVVLRTVARYSVDNPMTVTGCNLRKVPQQDLHCKRQMSIHDECKIQTLKELITLRDGYKECDSMAYE